MFEKSKGATYSQSRTDTILGPGVRIDGNVTFAGVLRTQGEILGDISCDADPNGTIVVAKSGNVKGTIRAAHVVVSGRVDGNVDSSSSVEIQPGACIVGDVHYRHIAIHEGGVIEGALSPRDATEGVQSEETQPIPDPGPFEDHTPSAQTAPVGTVVEERAGNGRKFGIAAAVLAAVVAVALMNRHPEAVTALPADDLPKAGSAAAEPPATIPPPTEAAVPKALPPAVAVEAAPAAPRPPEAEVKTVAQASPSEHAEVGPEQMVTVQGDNPSKSADFLFVSTNEPCVLVKKKRESAAEGTRIDVAQGASKRIAIARNEILRVAQGQDIDIFYQGRKVGPKTIQSGAWISFIPYSSGGAGDKQ